MLCGGSQAAVLGPARAGTAGGCMPALLEPAVDRSQATAPSPSGADLLSTSLEATRGNSLCHTLSKTLPHLLR